MLLLLVGFVVVLLYCFVNSVALVYYTFAIRCIFLVLLSFGVLRLLCLVCYFDVC